MPSRIMLTTSTNLLCNARPVFEMLTDSDTRLGNTSMNEKHWMDHHKMIGTLALLFRSIVISSSSVVCDADVDEHMVLLMAESFRSANVWTTLVLSLSSWLWTACTGTGDSTGGRAHSPRFAWPCWETESHGFLRVNGCMAERRMICTTTWPR